MLVSHVSPKKESVSEKSEKRVPNRYFGIRNRKKHKILKLHTTESYSLTGTDRVVKLKKRISSELRTVCIGIR